MGETCSMGEMKTAYKILVGKVKGKRPLVGRRRRWEDNIKMHSTETWRGVLSSKPRFN
jgi:hypothetical protein